MYTLSLILYILVFVLSLPVAVLLIQILASTLSSGSNIKPKAKIRPSIKVLMPAHNESLVITRSIESIKSQLSSRDELIVVADNCTDDTAIIASDLGATVVERFNEQARGKGFALDFGLQYLKKNPPEVVIIVDADCEVGESAIDMLAHTSVFLKRPVQALYLMEPPNNPNLKARIAAFAWLVKNKVRPLGAKALGFPCQLMGTGMAFLWKDICKVNLATGHIVEDMKLGVDLAILNKAPYFLPQALVTSIFPPTEAAVNTQRSRWEHGHLSVILNDMPKLLYRSIKNKNLQLFAMACDLLVPPLAMLALMSLIVLVLSFLVGGQLLILSTILLSCLLASVLFAWAFFGREIITFKQLCYAPVYALVKIPLYIKFFFNRQVEWVRSKRD